ncbi:hypothetical protein B1C78_14005 [Thioalkalivibrio denitrificans]|uniref:PhnB-like domain-containing protein n=1 Tax=Thioalkalivibrio denitrificans TaxID=108003 RepID=A0A1V3NDC0_9GAMM|nr:VOC family protein [Thioalkalivibrio denitrificans]OOG22786.1 hypothetical protein B1C78_14005 [Thioalkalivibrio denitrificans]
MQIQPYLFFHGRCEEAMGYYRKALDARVSMLMRYRESPDPMPPDAIPPGWEDKIMHAELAIGDAVLMLSDGCAETDPGFRGFSLSLAVPDAETADRMFAALLDGGEELMPLGETFFSPRFGMVSDRYGVSWMINLPAKDDHSN